MLVDRHEFIVRTMVLVQRGLDKALPEDEKQCLDDMVEVRNRIFKDLAQT